MDPLNPTEIVKPPDATETTQVVAHNVDVFELVYQGPDVNDGTINAKDLVEVLAGLTRTFTAVAFEKDLGNGYQLRFKDVESNSIHLIFEAVAFAKANPPTPFPTTGSSAINSRPELVMS
jgi:hypothetical protein